MAPPGKINPFDPGVTQLETIVVVAKRYPSVDLEVAKLSLQKQLQVLNSKTGFNTTYNDLLKFTDPSAARNFYDAVAQKLRGPNALSEVGQIEEALGNVIDQYYKNKDEIDRTDPGLAGEIAQLTAAVDNLARAAHAISPLVIDLDGDGLHTISAFESDASFDFGDEGKPIVHGWVSAGDALLAVDKNGNGKIDDISELFGGRNTDGFTLLTAMTRMQMVSSMLRMRFMIYS